MHLRTIAVACAAALVFGCAPAAYAAETVYPSTLSLPKGFRPNGIAVHGTHAYFGSLVNGAIYQADLRTGTGSLLTATTNGMATGMAADSQGRLFVAGGNAGDARVVDSTTGKVLADYPLSGPSGFINDVVLDHGTAWFTDSFSSEMYQIPLPSDGSLPPASAVKAVHMTGAFVPDPGQYNAAGIVGTPDSAGLVFTKENTGELYRMSKATGATVKVDLHGATLDSPDGMLLDGDRLYVSEHNVNKVAALTLTADGRGAVLNRERTDPRFDVPTRFGEFRDRLYLPNGQTSATQPDAAYTAVSIEKF